MLKFDTVLYIRDTLMTTRFEISFNSLNFNRSASLEIGYNTIFYDSYVKEIR